MPEPRHCRKCDTILGFSIGQKPLEECPVCGAPLETLPDDKESDDECST